MLGKLYMSDALRVAVVGYGLAGKIFHAPLIRATEGLELAAIVSSDAAKVHADLPDVAVVADYASILQDTSIDLIVLGTPDHLHAPQALAALDAGKAVVIDKPFAPTLAEAQAVAARAAERGALLSIFHNRRWDADFLTIKRLIAEGELGEIVQFESHFDRYRAEISDRWKDQRAGGVWQDLGPHLVDQAVQLFGMPDAVFGDIIMQKTDGTGADYAHVVLRYGTMRVILHMSQATQAHGLRFAVHGTAGSFIKHGLDPQEDQTKAGMVPSDPRWGVDTNPGVLTRIGKDGVAKNQSVTSERGNSTAYYAAVRDALRGVGTNPVPPQQALDVMAILDAAQRSGGAWVSLAENVPQ
jgi:predicted dehydrogenase